MRSPSAWPQLKLGALVVCLGLAACATATPYQPSEGKSFGYADERLSQNRFRVTFTGNSVTPRETVEDYLLLHAAQVTLAAGAQWFVFDTRDTQAHTSYFTPFNDVPGWGRPWGYGWYWHNWGFDDGQTIPITRYEAYAEIVLLTPDEAKKEPRALEANDVVAHLGPKATPPPPH